MKRRIYKLLGAKERKRVKGLEETQAAIIRIKKEMAAHWLGVSIANMDPTIKWLSFIILPEWYAKFIDKIGLWFLKKHLGAIGFLVCTVGLGPLGWIRKGLRTFAITTTINRSGDTLVLVIKKWGKVIDSKWWNLKEQKK